MPAGNLSASRRTALPVFRAESRLPRRDGVALATSEDRLPVVARLLLISLFIPWVVPLGALNVSPYRAILVFAVIPCVWAWASGKAGRMRLPDFAVLAYAIWCIISFSVNNGIQTGIQSGGILGVETVGGYFMGRCFIRNADAFRSASLVLFIMIMVILPFALVEWITGENLALRLYSFILPTMVFYRMPGRLGLERVQSVFEHPILFGVVCASGFALTFIVLGWGRSLIRRWLTTGLVALAVVTSLSSGPMLGMVAQGALIGWGWLFRPIRLRWKILVALVALAILSIQLFAKRPLPAVLLSSVALDMDNAYYRVLIWDYGFQSALNHPFFGVGFNPWEHASWMTESIDMFWLYHAIIFGFPAAAMMWLAFFSAVIAIGLKRGLDDRQYAFRMGYLICMSGFFIVGWAVHFWNATYVLFLFFLAGGMWILDVEPKASSTEESVPAAEKQGSRGAGRSRGTPSRRPVPVLAPVQERRRAPVTRHPPVADGHLPTGGSTRPR